MVAAREGRGPGPGRRREEVRARGEGRRLRRRADRARRRTRPSSARRSTRSPAWAARRSPPRPACRTASSTGRCGRWTRNRASATTSPSCAARSRTSIPGRKGKLIGPQAVRDHPVLRQFAQALFRQLHFGPGPHPGDPRAPRQRQGRAADGQRRDRRRAPEAVGGDGQARADGPHRQDARRPARGRGRRTSIRPIRPRPRRSARPRCSTSASAPRTC